MAFDGAIDQGGAPASSKEPDIEIFGKKFKFTKKLYGYGGDRPVYYKSGLDRLILQNKCQNLVLLSNIFQKIDIAAICDHSYSDNGKLISGVIASLSSLIDRTQAILRTKLDLNTDMNHIQQLIDSFSSTIYFIQKKIVDQEQAYLRGDFEGVFESMNTELPAQSDAATTPAITEDHFKILEKQIFDFYDK